MDGWVERFLTFTGTTVSSIDKDARPSVRTQAIPNQCDRFLEMFVRDSSKVQYDITININNICLFIQIQWHDAHKTVIMITFIFEQIQTYLLPVLFTNTVLTMQYTSLEMLTRNENECMLAQDMGVSRHYSSKHLTLLQQHSRLKSMKCNYCHAIRSFVGLLCTFTTIHTIRMKQVTRLVNNNHRRQRLLEMLCSRIRCVCVGMGQRKVLTVCNCLQQ
jgi:hypothetical protein